MAEPQNVAHIEEEHLEHSNPVRYVAVWVALLVFTVLTWAVSKIHLAGGWHITVALVIAIVKGALVALFFMHLWDQRGANRLVFITSLVFVALLSILTLTDYVFRFPLANPPGSEASVPWPAGEPPAPPPSSGR